MGHALYVSFQLRGAVSNGTIHVVAVTFKVALMPIHSYNFGDLCLFLYFLFNALYNLMLSTIFCMICPASGFKVVSIGKFMKNGLALPS